MKKLYLTLLTLLFAINIATAQLSLTKANNEPIIGDTNKAYLVDTGMVNIKTINAVTGNNVIWDYSTLTVLGNSVTSTIYTSSTAVASATDYPGTNFVQNSNNFFKSTATPTMQTELIGTNFSGIASLNFTNTAIVAKFPFTYANTYNDAFSGTVKTSTSNSNFSGNLTVNADGNGTLNIPGGQVFTNVLRVKTTQSTTVNGIITTPFPIPVTVRITNYDYYHATQKYPIFSVSYNSIAIFTPTVTARVSANTKSTVVGLNENVLLNKDVTVFPNPSNSTLNFTLNTLLNPKRILIYSQMGTLVYSGTYSSQITILNLAAGIYMLQLETDKGIIHKKIVKE